MKNKSKGLGWQFHPLWFGLYPFLFFTAFNIDQIYDFSPVRAGVATLLIIAIIIFLSKLAFPKRGVAPLVASWCILLFFSYGHVYGFLEGKQVMGWVWGRHRVIMIAWLFLAIGVGIAIHHLVHLPQEWNRIATIVGVSLLFLQVAQIGLYFTRQAGGNNSTAPAAASLEMQKVGLQEGVELPDVYYIILDSYARQDALLKYHNYNNSSFISTLEQKGFYVSECSQSNYSLTSLSIPSALNLGYVSMINPDAVSQNLSPSIFVDSIPESVVLETFESIGYKTVTFETGWYDVDQADVFYTRRTPWRQLVDFSQISDFENQFLRTTGLRVLEEFRSLMNIRLIQEIDTPEEDHYQRLLFVLDKLASVPDAVSGPKFVFLHLMSPHGPFVLSPDGEYEFTGDPVPGYTNQVTYLNNRVTRIIDHILEVSDPDPVIVLQADHGYHHEERMAILNAYLLPGDGRDALYPTITPVNSFRIVLNELFNTGYPMLEDVSYLSGQDAPYNFELVNYGCK